MTLNRAIEKAAITRMLADLAATNTQNDWDAVRATIRQYVSSFGVTVDGAQQLAAAGAY